MATHHIHSRHKRSITMYSEDGRLEILPPAVLQRDKTTAGETRVLPSEPGSGELGRTHRGWKTAQDPTTRFDQRRLVGGIRSVDLTTYVDETNEGVIGVSASAGSTTLCSYLGV